MFCFFQFNNLKAAGVNLVCVRVDLNTQELIKIGEGKARDYGDKQPESSWYLFCVRVDLKIQDLIKIGEGNARDYVDKDNTAFKMLSCFNIGNICNLGRL